MTKWARIAETMMREFPVEACTPTTAFRLEGFCYLLLKQLRSGRSRRGTYGELRGRLRAYREDLVYSRQRNRGRRSVESYRVHLPVWTTLRGWYGLRVQRVRGSTARVAW